VSGWLALMAAAAVTAASVAPLSPEAEQGRRVAERNCAMCHAVGPQTRSPNGGAPTFRALDLRYGNSVSLEQALRRVAKQGHFEMRKQAVSDPDIPALAAYIETLRSH